MLKTSLTFFLLVISPALCQLSSSSSIRSRVLAFCETDFRGDEANRVDFFKKEMRSDNGVDFASEPVNIINNFTIVSIDKRGDRAEVVVEYDLVATLRNVRRHGYPGVETTPGVWFDRADELVMIRNPRFRQKLSLVFDPAAHEWFIDHNVTPNVSKKALLDVLEKEVERERDILQKNKSHPDIVAVQTSLIEWNRGKITQIGRLNIDER